MLLKASLAELGFQKLEPSVEIDILLKICNCMARVACSSEPWQELGRNLFYEIHNEGFRQLKSVSRHLERTMTRSQ